MACSVEYRLRAVVDFSQYQTPDRSTRALLSRSKSNLNNAFHTGFNLPSSLAILCAWILAPGLFVHPNPVEKDKEVKNQTKNSRDPGRPHVRVKCTVVDTEKLGDIFFWRNGVDSVKP